MTDLTPAIDTFVATHTENQVAFLAELVRTPSDNPPGDCAPHAEKAAELLDALGLTVERHPVPQPTVVATGMVSATNLVVRHKFGPGPTIALNAHGDVVPPGEGWTADPYGAEIRDGWMIGRGAAVSKSDFATYAFALLALKDAGLAAGSVELHLTYDEEVGGVIGPKWLLDEGISRPDMVIAAGFSHTVVSAHNGCLHLKVTVNGRSAHAAAPDTGIDALYAATQALNALYAHRADLAAITSDTPGITHPTLTVGLIDGGINTNVVPDKVTLRLDRRLIPEEDFDAAEADLRARIAAAVPAPATCDIERVLRADALKATPESDRIAAVLCRHATNVLGKPVESHGVPLYTDARHYAAAGIPTVLYGAGPETIEQANAHRADERVPLAELAQATRVIAAAIADLATA